MRGKALYSLREDGNELQNMAHININRILELMTHHQEISEKLRMYAQSCIVMEKLCDYVCNCCCNADFVSDFSLKELAVKCSEMKMCCSELHSSMPKEKSDYIRCKKMMVLCDKVIKHEKTLNKTKKSKKTKKTKK